MIKKTYESLREHFVTTKPTPLDDTQLLKDLSYQIAQRDDFLMGAFIVWEDLKDENPKAIVFGNNEALFFHKELGNAFKTKAIETLKELTAKKLFISRLLHKQSHQRNKQIDLIHSCYMKTCFKKNGNPSGCKIDVKAEWYCINLLCELPDVFEDKEEKEQATEYLAVVQRYFPEEEGKYTVVYCPFLVPDGKPPANYFAVYKCINKCSTEDFLGHLSEIQHAGTLIYMRRAIANAINSKAAQLEAPLEKLRNLREHIEQVSGAISAIEAVMNPYYLYVADSELKLLKRALEPLFVNDGAANWHDIDNWNAVRYEKLRTEVWGTHKNSIMNELNKVGANVYRNYFSIFDAIPENCSEITYECKMAGYYAKALNHARSPLCWVLTSLTNATESAGCEKMEVVLDNEVPPLVFNLALSALIEKDATITPNIAEATLALHVVIPDDGSGKLGELCKLVNTKLYMDTISLSSGQKSTALALIIQASKEYAEIIKAGCQPDGDKFEMKLSYSLEDID